MAARRRDNSVRAYIGAWRGEYQARRSEYRAAASALQRPMAKTVNIIFDNGTPKTSKQQNASRINGVASNKRRTRGVSLARDINGRRRRYLAALRQHRKRRKSPSGCENGAGAAARAALRAPSWRILHARCRARLLPPHRYTPRKHMASATHIA